MRIEAGVRFLFSKAPVCKGFPIPFNDNKLYGDSEMVAVETFHCPPLNLFTKGLWGVHISMIYRQIAEPASLRQSNVLYYLTHYQIRRIIGLYQIQIQACVERCTIFLRHKENEGVK